MPAVPDKNPPSAPDEAFQGPMSSEAWAEIPPAKKLQMIPTFHQSIVHDPKMTEFVREALVQSINTLIAKGGNPNQALAIVAKWDDPVFKNMPQKTRKKFAKKITTKGKVLDYLVIPYERDLWTGGPGAPDWAGDHPYTEQMLKLCEEPEAGCLWIVVFAGAAASAFQLGDKPIYVPENRGGTEVIVEGEAEVMTGEAEAVTDTESDVLPVERVVPVDPFEP